MKFSSLLLFIVFATQTHAAEFKIPTLTGDDMRAINEEFSANFLFSDVSSAKSLGEIWGIELGVIGGITDAPQTQSIIKRVDSTTSIDTLAHAGLFGALTVPLGITAEVLMIPETKVADVDISILGLAGKWTITDVFFENFPLDVAVRGHFSSSKFSFTQDLVNQSSVTVKGTVELENTVYGADLLASHDVLIFEPYIGLGFASGETEVGVEGQGLVIGNVVDLASTAGSKDDTSTRFVAGLQLDLWLMHISAEYNNLFGTDRYSAKFSFYF